MHEIKLIRLQSGEDIICTCHEDLETKMVMLKDPMTVIYKRIKNGSILLISPWLPAELIEDNTATIYTSDILTTVEPKLMVKNYYSKLVDSLEKFKKEEEETLRQFLEDDSEGDVYDDELLDNEEDEIKEILELHGTKKNIKLH
jgi:hypothetical protein